jgi:hypothetical protein
LLWFPSSCKEADRAIYLPNRKEERELNVPPVDRKKVVQRINNTELACQTEMLRIRN